MIQISFVKGTSDCTMCCNLSLNIDTFRRTCNYQSTTWLTVILAALKISMYQGCKSGVLNQFLKRITAEYKSRSLSNVSFFYTQGGTYSILYVQI